MAQVELKFFKDLSMEDRSNIARLVVPTVAEVHYGITEVKDGDISLVVPHLEDLSSSDADFELEISEGSDNWPRNRLGFLMRHNAAKRVLDARAQRISKALLAAEGLRIFSHNIFEVSGRATGWLQYKPERSEEDE